MPAVIVLIGIPGSGKSTLACALSQSPQGFASNNPALILPIDQTAILWFC
jgi:adenylate kinase family enzyme